MPMKGHLGAVTIYYLRYSILFLNWIFFYFLFQCPKFQQSGIHLEKEFSILKNANIMVRLRTYKLFTQ